MKVDMTKDDRQQSVSDRELSVMRMSCSIQPGNSNIDKVEFPNLPVSIQADNNKESALKVCIVTQDIVGPIRNGGIGTAYRFVAELLSSHGFDVTILYALGNYSENETIEFWVTEYARLGVTFVPMPEPEVVNLQGVTGKEMTRAYGVYEWLKHQQFDLVHVSEWRGLGYYSLVAKKLGIAFPDTLFCVKTSSPTLWNMEGNSELVKDPGVLIGAYMERKSVELADVVVSGSKYMLQWMLEKGYQLPDKHVYVQPNIMPDVATAQIKNEKQGLQEIDEIVFFGRLEPRKGLHLFCDAINRLKLDILKPFKVTFLGKHTLKYGSKDLIELSAEKWSFPWQIVDDLGQPAAINYLSQPGRLAVMPSMMDNSPFGVYECLYNRIPFITSNIGGGPELIAEQDRESVLFNLRPTILAKRLEEILTNGIEIASASYEFSQNNQTWLDWHRSLATGKIVDYLSEIRSRDVIVPEQKDSTPLVTICVQHHNRHKLLAQALDSVNKLTYSNYEVVLVDDGSDDSEALVYLESIAPEFEKKGWRIIKQENLYLGATRNTGARNARGKYILDDDNYLKPESIGTFVDIAERTGADILTCFSEVFTGNNAPDLDKKPETRITQVGDCVAYGVIANGFGDGNAFIKRDTFLDLGGNSEDYGVGKDDQEFYARAVLNGYKLYHIPEALYWYRHSTVRLRHKHYRQHSGDYRVVQTYLQSLPHYVHPLILLAQGQAHAVAESSRKMPKLKSDKNNEVETFLTSRPAYYRIGRRLFHLEIALWNRFLNLQLWIATKLLRTFRKRT
ncbi:MAG: glycosyltransferase involved in cell wall biosynthesis [Gammaproteobacteria bacterium]|jgi:glycosyltransferase involved in cell wall biosynthesis